LDAEEPREKGQRSIRPLSHEMTFNNSEFGVEKTYEKIIATKKTQSLSFNQNGFVVSTHSTD
jgi:hypothetical protein